MATYSANSLLDENGVGVIIIESDTNWNTTSWSSTFYFENTYSKYNMYPIVNSGNGVLDDSGKILTIKIDNPPKSLRLVVGSFSKIFSFSDGGYDLESQLVYASSLKIYDGSGSTITTPSFVLFGASPDNLYSDTAPRATIANGKKVVAYAVGQRFVEAYANSNSNSPVWGFGGVLFPRIIWIDKPSASLTLDFYLNLNGNSLLKKVGWNGSSFTGPSSSNFQILSTDTFLCERLTNIWA